MIWQIFLQQLQIKNKKLNHQNKKSFKIKNKKLKINRLYKINKIK